MNKMTIFNKIKLFFKRPNVVLVLGSQKETAKEAISKVLSRYFKIGKEIIICSEDEKDVEFFLNKSMLPILAATRLGEYHPEKEFFAGDIKNAQKLKKWSSSLPSRAYLILNFDDETVRELKSQNIHSLTFGFGMRSDIRATDIVLTQFPAMGTNFKINYDGNIVPCWLENLFGKDNIYSALAAAATGLALGLNLVEVSQALKDFKGLPGNKQLIGGVKNSWILDDSESASSLSMLESLEILKKIEGVGRKIAVLGDILGVGKYAVEAHEAIGGEVNGSADLLFTVGERAKFFAEGAKIKGMPEDRIFQFNDAGSAAKALQSEIKEGDIILIDGSKEMNMGEIIDEIKIL